MTAAAGTAGPWAEWKRVSGEPIYVWKGPPQHGELPEATLPGLPTGRDFAEAPMYTIFPARVSAAKLPGGGHDSFIDDGQEFDVWFLSHVGQRYDSDVAKILEEAGVAPEGVLEYDVEMDGELMGQAIPFRGKPYFTSLEADDDIWGYAVEKGYTLIKVPEHPGGGHYSIYSMDTFQQKERGKFHWEQTPLLAELQGAAPAEGDPELLRKANLYRRSMGQARDLQPGEWSDSDLRELLQHGPRRFQNPQDARYQELKRSLMR